MERSKLYEFYRAMSSTKTQEIIIKTEKEDILLTLGEGNLLHIDDGDTVESYDFYSEVLLDKNYF